MTIALVGAFATIALLVGAFVWVVKIVRADGRERADALVLAEKTVGERNVAIEKASAQIATLIGDVNRQTRRADALEELARAEIKKRAGDVDDGVDLLMSELDVVATGLDDESDTGPTATGGPPAARGVPQDTAVDRALATGGGPAASHGDVPQGEKT